MSKNDNFEEVPATVPAAEAPVRKLPAGASIVNQQKTMRAADELEPYFDVTRDALDARTKQIHGELQDSHNKVSDLLGNEKKTLDINSVIDGISKLGAKFAGYGGRMAPVPGRPMSQSQMKKNLQREAALSDNPEENEGIDKAFGANIIRSGSEISERDEQARTDYNKTLRSQWRRRIGALKGAFTMRVAGPSFAAHEDAHKAAEAKGQGHLAVCGNSDCHAERQILHEAGEKYALGHYLNHHAAEGSLLHRNLTAGRDAIDATNPEPEEVDPDTFRSKARYQYYARLYHIASMASDKNNKVNPSHVRRWISDKVHRTMDVGGKRIRVGQEEDPDSDWIWDAGNTSVVEASKGPFDILTKAAAAQNPEWRAKKEAQLENLNPNKRSNKGKAAQRRNEMDDSIAAANQVIGSIQRFTQRLKGKNKPQTTAEANEVVSRALTGKGETRARGAGGNEISDNLAANGDQTAEDSGTSTGVTALIPKARVGLTRKAESASSIPAGASRRDLAKQEESEKAAKRAAAQKRRAAKKKSSKKPSAES